MYDGLLEALMSGDTSIPCPELQERYKQLKEVDPETKKSKLQDQFDVSSLCINTVSNGRMILTFSTIKYVFLEFL